MNLERILLLTIGAIVIIWSPLAAQVGAEGDDFNNTNNQEEKDGQQQTPSGLKNGKILDDSTKQIYGPTTTRYTFERRIKYNQPLYQTIDTSLLYFHRFNYVNKHSNTYQDLGNIGTAITPVFHQTPETIGIVSGFGSYDLYFKTPEQVRYYDTKSPFSQINLVLGGQGRSLTDVRYSRNINPTWNIGFDYKGLFIDKQINRTARGDRNATGIAYDAYTHYQHKNGHYQLLFNFSRNRQRVNETGGFQVIDDESTEVSLDDFFDEDKIDAVLNTIGNTVESSELRTNYHLYHEYKLSKIALAYHEMDRYKQQNDFTIETIGELPEGFLPSINEDSTLTEDRSTFRVFNNEFGVKGDAGPIFYNFYYRARKVKLDNKYLDESDLVVDGDNSRVTVDPLENYGGFNVRIQRDSTLYLEGFGQALISDGGVASGGFDGYRVGGKVQSKWLEGKLARVVNSPSSLATVYSGNHNSWINNFNETTTNELYGKAKLKLDFLAFEPFASLKSIDNFIYYYRNNEGQTLPVQYGRSFEIFSSGFDLKVNFLKRLHFRNKLIYSAVDAEGTEVYRVPTLFNTAMLYYENIIFNGNLQFQFGFDVHYQSAYKANAYDIFIQQFFVQDSWETPGYLAADFFINMKINRGRILLKGINLTQSITGTGYFASPLYPGQAPRIDFGFVWAFYD